MATFVVVDAPVKAECPGCGRLILVRRKPGPQRTWCSESCRVRTASPYKPAQPTERWCRCCAAVFKTTGKAFRCEDCRRNRRLGPLRACQLCAAEFWPLKATQRYCSKSCASTMIERPVKTLAPKGNTHQARARRFGVKYETVIKIKVFERDGWFCVICQTPVDRTVEWPHPDSASLDHVVPLSRGGEHAYRNTQCSHFRCNIAKGAD